MDPNANLQEQHRLLTVTGGGGRARLRELREALDQWISRGGAHPVWADYPDTTRSFREWQRNRRKFQDLYR